MGVMLEQRFEPEEKLTERASLAAPHGFDERTIAESASSRRETIAALAAIGAHAGTRRRSDCAVRPKRRLSMGWAIIG
jgi:hypothetical protein